MVDKTVIITSTTDATWTPPADWTNVNTIHCIGAGGPGRTANGGAGGGGGAWSSSSNFSATAGVPVNIQVGAGSSPGTVGEDTWFGSSSTIMAKGGGNATGTTTGNGAGGASGSGFGT